MAPSHSSLERTATECILTPVNVLFDRNAEKALGKTPAKVGNTILDRLEAIAANPFARHRNVSAMKGEKDAFRLRVGKWRVVYRLDRAADTLLVELIGPRGGLYK